MKRIWVLCVVLGMVLASAAPVGAAPAKCVDDPTLPGCPSSDPVDDPLGGTTCAEGSLAATDDFAIELEGRRAEACVDVSDVNPGAWDVTVGVERGTLRSLLVILRDSVAPGDACGEPVYIQDNIPAPATLTDRTLQGAPGSYVNACGVEWAEWVDGAYYDSVDDTVDSPLAFLVFTRGSRDLAVSLDVNLP